MTTFLIRDLMEESRKRGHRVTQTDLAKAAGVAIPTITRLVNNQRKRPEPGLLQSIAKVFTEVLGREITIDDLIEKEREETPSPPAGIDNVDINNYRKIGEKDYAWLPLYGDIPCGDLSHLTEEHIIEHLPFLKSLIGAAQLVLRARGDSMEPSIQDGDLLLIETGNQWKNKDIVIAWVDGEVTCKRLQMNHSPALLVPDNRDYKVIQVSDETLILGRVVGQYKVHINDWKP